MRVSDKQITLGQLIDALKTASPTGSVRFDWCDLHPAGLASYRGYYEDLAIGFMCEKWTPIVTVSDFLLECQSAIGKTFEGYKGGDFEMDRDTVLWVANYGSSTGWAIVGVKVTEFGVTLKTKLVDK